MKKQVKLLSPFIMVIIFYEIVIRFLPQASTPASFSGEFVLFLQAELSSKAMDYFTVTVYSVAYPLLVYGAALFLLWRKDFSGFVKYLWVFIIAQALAMITWGINPVAPPRLAVAGVRGVRRSVLGFTEVANPFVWGAFPSMHAANGLAAVFFVRKHGKKISIPWGGIWLVMVFSAIYLGDHYWLDPIAGCFYFLIAYLLVVKASGKLPLLRSVSAKASKPH